MLNITTIPNPLLRQKSLVIKEPLAQEIQDLLPEMIETMIKKDGVGLAAPQIGLNIRLIVVRHKDNDIVMINPEILKKSLFKEWDEEGCLSVPGVFGQVKRHKKLTVRYLDGDGKSQQLEAEGFFARVIQHEVDHLNGVLFIDKAKDLREETNE